MTWVITLLVVALLFAGGAYQKVCELKEEFNKESERIDELVDVLERLVDHLIEEEEEV